MERARTVGHIDLVLGPGDKSLASTPGPSEAPSQLGEDDGGRVKTFPVPCLYPPTLPTTWPSSQAEVVGAGPVGEEYACPRHGLLSEHKDPTRADGKTQSEKWDKWGRHQRRGPKKQVRE